MNKVGAAGRVASCEMFEKTCTVEVEVNCSYIYKSGTRHCSSGESGSGSCMAEGPAAGSLIAVVMFFLRKVIF